MSLSFTAIKEAIESSNFNKKEYEILNELCGKKVRSKSIEEYIRKAERSLEDFEEYEEYVLGKEKEENKSQREKEIQELNQLVSDIEFISVELKKYEKNTYEYEEYIIEFILKSQETHQKKYSFCWIWEHDNRREESESSNYITINEKSVGFEEIVQELQLKYLDSGHLASLINWIYGIFPCNLDIDWC